MTYGYLKKLMLNTIAADGFAQNTLTLSASRHWVNHIMGIPDDISLELDTSLTSGRQLDVKSHRNDLCENHSHLHGDHGCNSSAGNATA